MCNHKQTDKEDLLGVVVNYSADERALSIRANLFGKFETLKIESLVEMLIKKG